jgi:hypothetical protein
VRRTNPLTNMPCTWNESPFEILAPLTDCRETAAAAMQLFLQHLQKTSGGNMFDQVLIKFHCSLLSSSEYKKESFAIFYACVLTDNVTVWQLLVNRRSVTSLQESEPVCSSMKITFKLSGDKWPLFQWTWYVHSLVFSLRDAILFDVFVVNRKDATMNWMIFQTKPIMFSRMIIVMQTGQSSKPVW